MFSVYRIGDATFRQLKEALALWDSRGVIDLADSLLALALPQEQPCRRCVSDDIATHRLLWIDGVGHATTRISSDLVGDEDRDVELLTDFLQAAQNAVEDLLSLSELSTA